MSKLQKMEEKNDKHFEKVKASRDALSFLSKKMEEHGLVPPGTVLTYDNQEVETCTLDVMAKLNLAHLHAIIYAHDPNHRVWSKLPKKGNVTDAKNGVANAILVAYNCRLNKNIIEG